MIKIKAKKNLITSHGPLDLDVDFQIQDKEFITLFGSSGAGKTTILRMLAGLTDPGEGFIQVDDEIWFDSDKKINRPTQERQIGFVFQDYSLFPNMTVAENLEFAKPGCGQSGQMKKLLEAVDMISLKDRRPQQLSGGQNQRVAILRAVLRQPKLLLLDEPFSALDVDMRLRLQQEVFEIHKKFNVTTVFVSHHLAEVFRLSDRVVILEGGVIAKSGPPDEVFFEKRLSGKFTFIGEVVDIKKEDVIYILTVLVGNNFVRTVATDSDIENINVGDKVVVSSKAFNPIVMKI